MSEQVGLRLARQNGETWKEAALRVARVRGLEEEVGDAYTNRIKQGDGEEAAAWGACYEWDLLDITAAPFLPFRCRGDGTT